MKKPWSWLRARASLETIAATTYVVLTIGLLGFVPLLAGPGYEISLIAGVLLPTMVAVYSAGISVQTREAPLRPMITAVERALGFSALAYALTLLHGARIGFCGFWQGTENFWLGPGVGCVLASMWGVWAGQLSLSVERPRRARWARNGVAVLGPLGAAALSVWRFYDSPMVFAYDPFAGYFSGSLYDTVIELDRLETYRLGSLATVIFSFAVARQLVRDEEGRLRIRWPERPFYWAMVVVPGVLSVASMAAGPYFDHWHTRATIASALGGHEAGARCDVIFDRGILPDEVRRFTQDCDAHVAAGEAWFEGKGPPRVTAFLFRSREQKGRFMGAAGTYIAKPWRNEVYLQTSAYPHRVLGHEIMHVIAGAFGRGPFRVAGEWGGMVPNPGIIEGVAVASSPKEGDLSPSEWAKTMKDLELLPPLSNLFAFGFFGENSSLAYAVSGSFIGFLHDTYGAKAVTGWYGGGDLTVLTGRSWDALEAEWHGYLDSIEVTEAALAQAEKRFDRPAIFDRRCPRLVDSCLRRADRLAGSGDEEGALTQLERAASYDEDPSIRLRMARLRARDEDAAEAQAAFAEFARDEALPRHIRDDALEEQADLALAVGDVETAAQMYRDLMTRKIDEDDLRTLEVKIDACEHPRVRSAIGPLLLDHGEYWPDQTEASEIMGRWSAEEPTDALPHYLMARYYLSRGDYAKGAAKLDEALSRDNRIERVRIETERLRIVAACGLGDAETARKMFVQYAAHPTVMPARREAIARLVERCSGRPIPFALPPSHPGRVTP